MSHLQINDVLAQIRSLGTQANSNPKPPSQVTEPAGFVAVLQTALQRVNEADENADRLANAFELGDPQIDLAQVMLAGAKADISFRATVEVRNRLVGAYQEIMNMPL